MRRQKIAIAALTAAFLLVIPGIALGTITEIGLTSTQISSGISSVTWPAPACPTTPCAVVSRTTGFQVKVTNSNNNIVTVQKNGSIVAWTIALSSPTKDQISYFNTKEGGAPEASIAVLRGGPHLTYRLLAQSPLVDLTPYMGQTVQFPLATSIPVVKGSIIALTVPTWAPALALGFGNDTSWRSSRPKADCSNVQFPSADSTLQAVVQYYCLYRTARLSYSATLVSTPETSVRSRSRLAYLAESFALFGLRDGVRFWAHWLRSKVTSGHPLMTLTMRRTGNPLSYRLNTSDTKVLRQIFFDHEYACVDDLSDVDLILDCGANVGYSAIYLLDRHPGARLVAVEPDLETFGLLRRNLEAYAARVELLQAGVWSHPAGLVVERDGGVQSWAFRTREVRADEVAELQAVDVPTLLGSAERVSLLKVDIEGAERVVFASAPWMAAIDNIVIELHGPECEEVFAQAIAGEGFTVSQLEERTICRR